MPKWNYATHIAEYFSYTKKIRTPDEDSLNVHKLKGALSITTSPVTINLGFEEHMNDVTPIKKNLLNLFDMLRKKVSPIPQLNKDI